MVFVLDHYIANILQIYSAVTNSNLLNHNLACAVCCTPTHSTMMMIQAWTHCPASWTNEYVGYIMTEHKHIIASSTSVWIRITEAVPGEKKR